MTAPRRAAGPGLELVQCAADEADVTVPDALHAVHAQTTAALEALDAPETDDLAFPWASLDTLTGYFGRGQLWYVAAFSGDGKTSFLTSLVLDWIARGVRVYYLGLETSPFIVRTHFACKRLGYHTGEIVSRDYRRLYPHWQVMREHLRAEIKRLSRATSEADAHRSPSLLVSEVRELDVLTLRAEAAQAVEYGMDVLVVDHVDHLAGEGRERLDLSVAVNKALVSIKEETGLRILAASQLNLDAVKGHRIMRYTPPRDNVIWLGSQKRHVADGMLGIYRPLKLSGLDPDAVKRFNLTGDGRADVLEPNTMAISLLKHRLYGEREGDRVYLDVTGGRVRDIGQDYYRNPRNP